MKLLMILLTLLLCGCSIIKQKERITKDSLFHQSIKNEWLLNGKAQLNMDQIWKKDGQQSVFIIATAPFRWQADSGLIAGAGQFQINSEGKETQQLQQKQVLQTTAGLKNKEDLEQDYHYKNVKETKVVEKLKELKWLWIALAFIIALGFFWSRFRG